MGDSRAEIQLTCVPRPSGLIAWYRGEGNGNDSVGDNHGMLRNDVQFTTGQVQQSFLFNGTNEVVVPNAPSLNPAHLTIEGWVYPTLRDGGVDIIVNKDSEPFAGYQYEISVRGEADPGDLIPVGNLAFALRGVQGLPNEYFGWTDGGGSVPLNTWTHVAVTYDGSTARAYVNGVPTRTLTGLSGSVSTSNGPLKIGSRSETLLADFPNERFNGRIDEISLYNRALSAEEILAIFNAGSFGKCPVENTAPSITAGAPLARQQGSAGTVATLATVTDLETPAGGLTVTATTVPAGITVSNLTNINGMITAMVAAGCNALAGTSTVVLTVTDSAGATATANLSINVTANTPPVQGVYPSTIVNVGQSTSATPNTVPTDNGMVASVTAAASAGFTGTIMANSTTGVVTLSNAAPAGVYVVTVTATDNCGATSNTPFNLTVNKFSSTTQLTVSAGPYIQGQPVTLTATVTATGAGTPTGTVTFFNGTIALGIGPLNAAGQATLTTTALPLGSLALTAMYTGDANYAASTSMAVTILIARPVVNVSAASFRGEQLAQEQIIAAFGTNLAAGTQMATTLPLPTTLAGTTIQVKDSAGTERTAQLFFVSPSQINYLMPAGTANGTAIVTITNTNGSQTNISIAIVQIATVAPGLFSANATGSGLATAEILRVQPDGRQSYEPVVRFDPALNRFVAIPIEFGPPAEQLFLLLYGTGFRFRSSLNNVTVTLGGMTAPLLFVGAQGNLAGFDQANLRIPGTLTGRGEIEILLTVDGNLANSVRVNFR